jgi:hypothetical protein
MNNKLSNLVVEIEKWFLEEYNNAPDKEFLSYHLLKQYDILNHLKVNNIGIFNSSSKIYNYYRLGKFEQATNEFEKYVEGTLRVNSKLNIKANNDAFTPPLIAEKRKKLTKNKLEIKEGLFEQLYNYIKFSEAERLIRLNYNDHYIHYKTKFMKNLETLEEENYVNKLIPIEVIIKHFEVLKCKNERNGGKRWLTEDDFNKFIGRAFNGKKGIEKLTLIVGKAEKGLIVDRFHSFYTLAVNHYNENWNNTELYIRYLTDNFTNYTFEEVNKNFRTKGINKNGWEKYEKK